MSLPEDKRKRLVKFLQQELGQDLIWILLFEHDGGGVLAGNCKQDAIAQCVRDHLDAIEGAPPANRMTHDPGNDPTQVALGHLVCALRDGALSQGFQWDRDWVLGLLDDAGLMREDAGVNELYHLTPLAIEFVDAYLAAHPEAEEL
jgi:hypothetical protein